MLSVHTNLIIDSGSTKADWAIIRNGDITLVSTQGINPSSERELPEIAKLNTILRELPDDVYSIFYYGAGVIDTETKGRIKTWLSQKFKHCDHISIHSDMLGACRALAHNNRGIISILGTGANSCTYDGSHIMDNIPALGFSLSNEGSGTDIGKAILQSYFYRKMPANVKIEFESLYEIDKSTVVNALYRQPNPTAYLAKFASFINQTENKTWRKETLAPLFQKFIDIRIKSYEQYSSYGLYFVGSIAYFCQDILKEILENNNLQMVKILQKPIDGLIEYHKNIDIIGT